MSALKEYLFSVIVCALGCGIVSQLVSDTKKKSLIHLVSGVIFAITILKPLTKIDLEKLLHLPVLNQNSVDLYIAEGERNALDEQARCIKASCEAYILDKAKTLGAEITAQVILNEDLIPVLAEIRGEVAPNIQSELQKTLTTDLGIPKENQKWTWNQESSGSSPP